MLSKRRSTSVPQLRFTHENDNELRALANALEREAVDLYEHFLFRHRRRVDTTRWKAVRCHEDLHVYCERDDYRKTWRHESKMPATPGPMATLAAHSSVPMVFVTGSVQGSLDDALFGNAFLDAASLRVRDAYLAQKSSDATLLHVIDAPHSSDPFGFLGVTYATRKSAVAMGRPRDMVLLSGVHTSSLSTGERIGIVFHHSIQDAALSTDDAGTVHAEASMVAIYRQLDESRVDVFVLDFCDLRGKTPSSSAVKQSIALLVPRASECVDAAVKKKLHWLMCERQRGRALAPERRDRGLSDFSCMSEPRVDVDFCDICDTSLRRAGKLSSSSCICQLCGEQVCGKCAVTKSIAIDATTTHVEEKPFAFCVACLHQAKTHSAADVAQRELEDLWTRSIMQSVHRHKPRHSDDDDDHSRPTTLID